MNDTVLLNPPLDADAGAEAAPPAAPATLSRTAQGVQKKIRRLAGRAIQDFSMIEDGDLVMACLSGGADSYTMLDTLLYLKSVAPIDFNVIAVNLDQKQPGFPEDVLPTYLGERGIPYRIVSGSGSQGPINAELTIDAGVTILMDPSQGWNVANGGSIKAEGTMADPIVIRGAASAPAAGYWNRITFTGTASTDSTFSWTTISDGQQGVLTITDNTVSASDTTFSNNATCDVVLSGTGMLADACTCMYSLCP